MPSQTSAGGRRRQRIPFNDEDDLDDLDDFSMGSPDGESSAKRVRTNGYSDNRRSQINGNGTSHEPQLNGHQDRHQPGAIIKVKLTNFVTYESAAFYPGPNLNMIIGPNGVGKSSLVCAICLGLGWGTKVLGRAEDVGAFVKFGEDQATIEIELQGRSEDQRNPMIRVLIIKDGHKRKWWINNRESTEKAVQALVHGLSIQVDNLCQFLPQEKVSEFARQTPVQLLHATQRAAAPPQMLEWHDELKKLRNTQRNLQRRHEGDQEQLTNLEGRQQGLRHDVQRLKERAAIQEKIAELEKQFPFVEYRVARAHFQDLKKQKDTAQRRLNNLTTELEPSLRAVNDKQAYRDQIETVVTQRTSNLSDAQKAVGAIVKEISRLDEKIKESNEQYQAELKTDTQRKQELQRLQAKIRQLEVQLANAPPAFDHISHNNLVREKEHRQREIETEDRQLVEREAELTQQGRILRDQINRANADLQVLGTQAGLQQQALQRISRDTAEAWKWVQENQDRFEKQVFGPVAVECSVTDPRYIDVIESLFQKNDFTSFTVQSRKDFRTLQEQLYGKMKLADITIKTCTSSLSNFRPPMSKEDMQALGFDGWAQEFLKGPDPVLAMLCGEQRIYETGVSLTGINDHQLDRISKTRLTSYVAGRTSYRTTRRAQYGPNAVSTMTRPVRPGRIWKDQPMDTTGDRVLTQKINSLTEQYEPLKAEVVPLREKRKILKDESSAMTKEIEDLQNQKNEIQRHISQHQALPTKIDREKTNLQERRHDGENHKQRLQDISISHDKLVLEKGDIVVRYKDQLTILGRCHQELLEAQVRFTEAASDADALASAHSGMRQRLEEEKAVAKQAARDSAAAKDAANKLLAVCLALMEEMGDDAEEYFNQIPEDASIEDLNNAIDAEKSKLDYVQAGNSNAIKEYERRQIEVEKLTQKIKDVEEELGDVDRDLQNVRRLWEPELDKLVSEINEAFSYNFQQMGCAGEVSIHKDEDFDKWAIYIKVKFREADTLQLLDQHRQSGGERSVSTVFYLMSLQSLAQAPFRLVDEINQGMDPRNERMVHERMVDIACKEHTSQYFLITPKLLTGLKYDKRMKVLCVVSGEYMPEDHKTLDLANIVKIKKNLVAASS